MPLPSGLGFYFINGIVIGYLNNSPLDVLIAAYMIKKNSAIFKHPKIITVIIPTVNKPMPLSKLKLLITKLSSWIIASKGTFLKMVIIKIGIAIAISTKEYNNKLS
jgi:hypothetical protein